MTRNKPITEGTWNKIASKHYRHESGVEVAYRPNSWVWEIVGGKYDGLRYDRLWAAQHQAPR